MPERTVGVLPLLDLLKALRSLGADPGQLRRAVGLPPNALRDLGARVDRTRVARRLGMSPRTLQRALAREGVTFKEVRDDVLWDGVHGLLANPQCSVQAVAMQAGFADSAAFSKAFKRRMGCSPSGYRKRLAG